jgi:hypothetical protein
VQKAKAITAAKAKAEAGPSLRLKNAYAQDDGHPWEGRMEFQTDY